MTDTKTACVITYLKEHENATLRDAAEYCGCALSTAHQAVRTANLKRVVVWRA